MTPQTAFIRALGAEREVRIIVRGRRTGRSIALPVWFVLEGASLWLLPVRGSRSQWFRNLLADPTITVQAGRRRFTGRAHPLHDPQQAQAIADKFRQKYGADQVARYYTGFDACVQVPIAEGSPS